MKKWDYIIIVLLVSISFIPYGIKFLNSKSYSKIYAEVSINGELVQTISLDDSSFKDTLTFKSDFGINKLKIENNCLSVIDSDCPDHICEESIPASQSGDIIVCLPNRFVVEIKGEELNNSETDAVSHWGDS